MSYYKKFISYIDVYEHDEKIRNIGFIKSEIRDDIWKLNIIIKGLPATDTLKCEIKTADSEQHLEQIQLVNGGGSYTFIYNIKELLNGEILFSDIKGLRFQLSSNRYGLCRWEKSEQKEENIQEQKQDNLVIGPLKIEYSRTESEAGLWQFERRETIGTEPEKQETIGTEPEKQETIGTEPEKQKTIGTEPEKQETIGTEPEKQEMIGTKFGEQDRSKLKLNGQEFQEHKFNEEEFMKVRLKAQELKEKEETLEDVALPNYQLVNISSDKWQQLCRMYPEVHPFEEEETGEFISVQPKDFVIMNQKCQNLVNNSFLLHGYFNYKHILLGKKKIEKHIRYFIGVPGIFHDREKMVAVMFGFEAFEAVEKEIQGAFGYYMKEVEI